MTLSRQTLCRRTVLGSFASGLLIGLAGCSALGSDETDDSTDEREGPIQAAEVDGTSLVIEFEPDSLDRVNLVDPSGELFARRSIEAGVSQTSVEIGVDYDPGEYDLVARFDGETVETRPIPLEPDLELVDLRLARNHPEEMYEGASDMTIEAETILTIRNAGTGPTAILSLRFEGDVPNPTHESFDQSGIYDSESGWGGQVESVEIGGNSTVTLYSRLFPFILGSKKNDCRSIGDPGQFSITLSAVHPSQDLIERYSITSVDSGQGDCDISIEAVAS